MVSAAKLPLQSKQSLTFLFSITCKSKRLKCDETKPGCLQCSKRNVECGGYAKDFKWRPFEESAVASKVRKNSMSNGAKGPRRRRSDTLGSLSSQPKPRPLLASDFSLPNGIPRLLQLPSPPDDNSTPATYTEPTPPDFDASLIIAEDACSQAFGSTDFQPHHGSLNNGEGPLDPGVSLDMDLNRVDDVEMIFDEGMPFPFDEIAVSGPEELSRALVKSPTTTSEFFSAFCVPNLLLDESTILSDFFTSDTCRILNIRNNNQGNEWLTIVGNMAASSTSLHHAINSMTAFHMSLTDPSKRVNGVDHMRQSITALSASLGKPDADMEAAVATTLVLANAEAWDRHTASGIAHIRGTRTLLNHALAKAGNARPSARLRFLYNVWVYLDVLARLTSDLEEEDEEITHAPILKDDEIDPLLGFAATLFPILAKVANLTARVRRSDRNDVSIVSQAVQLSEELQAWQPRINISKVKDVRDIPSCQRTAEAYRLASLLLLNQAVPEIADVPNSEITEKILITLAAIPATSRTLTVHIFPLLSGSCGAATPEQRAFSKRRWEDMNRIMAIGNVRKAAEVMSEVWKRRDRALVPHDSLRGSMHWQTVMKEKVRALCLFAIG